MGYGLPYAKDAKVSEGREKVHSDFSESSFAPFAKPSRPSRREARIQDAP